MKTLLSFTFVLSCALLMVLAHVTTSDAKNICFSCGAGSSCKMCPSPSGKDTAKDRKLCRERGCKVAGTTSCSTPSGVKICR
ncbi:MAG TPA: hypothetical protein PKG59_14695 [Spirochaetota bacterium]|nr:hypothetical protein [Spirochaetota bacterium]